MFKMEKNDMIPNDELEMFKLTFSGCTKRDATPLKSSNLSVLDLFGSVVLCSNRSSLKLVVLAYTNVNFLLII